MRNKFLRLAYILIQIVSYFPLIGTNDEVNEVITLYAVCDEILQVYEDGVRATSLNGHESDWWAASKYNINGGAKLLALSCQNKDGSGNLLASTSTGVKTDASWRCADVLETGWQTIGFTETAGVWGEPTTTENLSDRHTDISTDALKLWIGSERYFKTIYCRKFL